MAIQFSQDGKAASSRAGRVIKAQVHDIIVAERHRKELGDLKALAESIKTEGLLQPIGITEGNVLVFGERRLRACQAYLKWEEIDARIVNVTSIVAGEFAENELRKAFTPSERLEIAKAVEREIGKRQGTRTDVIPIGKSAENKAALVSNRAQVAPGTKTRDAVAKAAGFTSHQQMERTEKVVTLGAPAVVDRLDKGEVSVSNAAEIVNLPKDEQVVALDGAKAAKEDREAAAESLRLAIQVEIGDGGANAYTDYVMKHGVRPDKATAASIGTLLGRQVKADDGSMQPPKTRAQKDADRVQRTAQKEKNIIGGECHRVTVAIAHLAANKLDPVVVAQNIDRWQKPHFEDFERAVEWLNRFAEEWRRRVQADSN